MSQQINLFNPAFEPQRNLLSANKMAAALAGLAVVMAALVGVTQARVIGLREEAQASARKLEQAQARLAKASVEFAPRKPDPVVRARLEEALVHQAALQKVEGVLQSGALGSRQDFAEYFRALARQSRQGMWLTGVTIDSSGLELGVRGRALDGALVPGYIARLSNEPVMRGKPIGDLVIAQPAPRQAADSADAALPPFVEFQFQSAPAKAAQETKP